MAGAAVWRGMTGAPAHWAARPFAALEAQRGHLFPWTPVCLGAGIGLWFAAPVEPGRAVYLVLALAVLALVPFALLGPGALRPVAAALALASLGVLAAGARAHWVAAPVLDFRFYGAIEGRVVELDRSLSDKPRLTLDRVVLEGMRHERMPERVRISLHGRAERDTPPTGATVILTGHLSAPNGPAEPGGFDFRRVAWFEQLGGVGYTRSPVLLLEQPEPGRGALAIAGLRRAISEGVRARIPGDPGGFASAVLTGDRSGIGRAALDDLRDSGLVHILSISGLHMALLTGFVFALVRVGLALVPPLALRLPAKKIAAVAALAASAFYLALSGGDTPAERSFVMAAVMLLAVLLDRQALSLRAIAAAALIVLIRQPEALVNPGFQMSFAATAALIVAFQASKKRRLPGWASGVAALFLSSLVAGAASAPYAAAHFNRVADYSILANMLSVPVMGTFVMPAGVIAAILWPLGLSAPALWVMEQGNRWILWVAEWVTDLPGAVTMLPTAPPAFLPVFTLGGLVLMLWQGRGRWAGLAPMAAACVLWALAERPTLLVADSGGIFGLMTGEGRVLSKPSGDSYAARAWLENDGDRATQEDAAARPGLGGAPGALVARLGGAEIVQIAGRGWRERLAAECRAGRILVVAQRVEEEPGPCTLLDPRALARTGAIAGHAGPEGLVLVSAAERAGFRLWTGARDAPGSPGAPAASPAP